MLGTTGRTLAIRNCKDGSFRNVLIWDAGPGLAPVQAVPRWREAALHSNCDTTVPWVIQGFTSTTPSRALRLLLRQAYDTFKCL
jgi:hypothetical protein